MTAFRIFLFASFALIAAYTIYVMAVFGPIFIQVALGLLTGFDWPGQFVLDFGIYLMLSALWVMWRNGFSAFGIGFGLAASVLGAIVLLPYLIFLTYQCAGDPRRVLLGVQSG